MSCCFIQLNVNASAYMHSVSLKHVVLLNKNIEILIFGSSRLIEASDTQLKVVQLFFTIR